MRALNGSNIVQVKSHNRQAILLQLLRAPLSRAELAKKLDLSATTITNLMNELLAAGWVVPANDENQPAFHDSGRGRPRTRLCLEPESAYVIGVHIGIGTFRLAQVNLLGQPVRSSEAIFDPAKEAPLIIAQISDAIQAMLAEVQLKPGQILGIGFGASGLVDTQLGINIYAPSLNWQEIPVANLLQAQTGLPVVVENNVRAMAVAESYFGLGRDVGSLAFIFGRIGIGAGLIMHGRIMRGIRGGAGEIGHTTIMPHSGVRCRCGQTGCLETLVTQPVLLQALAHHPPVAAILEKVAGETAVAQFDQLLELARSGDAVVRQAIEQVATYLGIALTNLVNTINPESIILGGMYAQGADLFLPLLRQQVAASAFGRLGQDVQIDVTQFGLDAGVIGAASVALVRLFYTAEAIPA